MAVADLPPSLKSSTTSIAEAVEPDLEGLLAGGWKGFDAGTEILVVRDLSATLGGTMIADVRYEGLQPDIRRVGRTRMGRIRELAPDVSLRDWATALGVSAQAIRNWSHREPPDRPQLETVLRLLQDVSARRPRLDQWLKQPLSPDGIRPLDLMAHSNWRAFRASARLVPAASNRKGVSPAMEARLIERHRALRAVRGPEPQVDDRGTDDAS
jgi:hypothetical protein